MDRTINKPLIISVCAVIITAACSSVYLLNTKPAALKVTSIEPGIPIKYEESVYELIRNQVNLPEDQNLDNSKIDQPIEEQKKQDIDQAKEKKTGYISYSPFHR